VDAIETITWTYEATRITELSSYSGTWVFDLTADGRVMHYEGPEGLAASDLNTVDWQYDDAGHIVALSGRVRYSEGPNDPVMVSSYSHQYTYDAAGRIASAASQPDPPTTYTYTETPGHLMIDIAGPRAYGGYSYDFDADGRVVRAVAEGAGENYAYSDDAITATADIFGGETFEVDATGACTAPSAVFGPEDPLPIRLEGNVLTLPDPIGIDFQSNNY
jgi:hypothetical protein